MKEELVSVRNIIHDTVVMLCRNGVPYKGQLKVQGLLGVTLDDEEIFLVHFNEVLSGESNGEEYLDMDSSDKTAGNSVNVAIPDHRIGSDNMFGYKSKYAQKLKNAGYSQTIMSRRKLQKRAPALTPQDKLLRMIAVPLHERLLQKDTLLDGRITAKLHRNSNNHGNRFTDVIQNDVNARNSGSDSVVYSEVSPVKTELHDADESVNLASSVESSVVNDNFFDASLNIKSKQCIKAEFKFQKAEIKTKLSQNFRSQIHSANVTNPTFETFGEENDVHQFNGRSLESSGHKTLVSNETSSSTEAGHSREEVKNSSDDGTAVNGSWEETLIDASTLSNVVYSSFDDLKYNISRTLAGDAFSSNDYSVYPADPFNKTSWQEFTSGDNYKAITAVVRDCISCGNQYADVSENLRLPHVPGLKRTSAEKMKVFRAKRRALHCIVMSCSACRERVLALSAERCSATARGTSTLNDANAER